MADIKTGNADIDNMVARFDISQATESMILELADMIQPYITASPAVFIYWIDLLLKSDEAPQSAYNAGDEQ